MGLSLGPRNRLAVDQPAAAPRGAPTPTDQRKRALIDAGATLVLTMLVWPFPIARAMLAPAVNVLLILLTWEFANIVYHAVCARVWRHTAGTYLLGLSLCDRSVPEKGVSDAAALKWGVVAGMLVVVTAVWGGASTIIERASRVELRAWKASGTPFPRSPSACPPKRDKAKHLRNIGESTVVTRR